jgi:hypothetical protein
MGLYQYLGISDRSRGSYIFAITGKDESPI